MADRGWEAKRGVDGSYSFEATEGQKEAFLAENAKCLELIGANLTPVKSDEEWKTIFDDLVVVHECLLNQGLQLPDPPTFQSWLDNDRNWGPYGDVPMDVIEDRLGELEGACPQPTVW